MKRAEADMALSSLDYICVLRGDFENIRCLLDLIDDFHDLDKRIEKYN